MESKTKVGDTVGTGMRTASKLFLIFTCLLVAGGCLAFLIWRFYFLPLDYHIQAGSYGLGNSQPEMAEYHFRIARKYNPFSLDLKGNLGEALVELGKYEEAEPLLRARLAKESGFNYLSLSALTKLCIAQNRLDEAEQYAWQLEKSDKRLAEFGGPLTDAYAHLTEIYRRRGDYKKAEEYGIKAIENAKWLPPTPIFLREAPMKALVDFYNESGQYDGAEVMLLTMAVHYPNEPDRYFELAKTEEYRKDKAAALEAWQKFLKLSSDYVDEYHPYKTFDIERTFAQKRLIEIEKGNFLKPPSPGARVNWGEIPDK